MKGVSLAAIAVIIAAISVTVASTGYLLTRISTVENVTATTTTTLTPTTTTFPIETTTITEEVTTFPLVTTITTTTITNYTTMVNATTTTTIGLPNLQENTIPGGCCDGIDDDADGYVDGYDPDCQNNVNLQAGYNEVCWGTEWNDYGNNRNYSSGWFKCPEGYIAESIDVYSYEGVSELSLADNGDCIISYNRNNQERARICGPATVVRTNNSKTDWVKVTFISDSSGVDDGVRVYGVNCSLVQITNDSSTSTTSSSTTISSTSTSTIATTTMTSSNNTNNTTTSLSTTISTTVPKECQTAADCNDNNECTNDICQSGVCLHNSTQDGTLCNDHSTCTSNDHCVSGNCIGQQVNCDDGNPCTTDTCNTTLGCTYTNNNNLCDDGNPCTINDICSVGACHGIPKDCSELSDSCNDGSCNPTNGNCVKIPKPDGTSCGSSNTCHNGECITDTTTIIQGCQSGGNASDGLCHVECNASSYCAGKKPGEANTCCSGCFYTDITGPSGVPDGKVDARDVSLVSSAYGSKQGPPPSSNWNPLADINKDGKVDVRDTSAVSSKFGTTCSVKLGLAYTNILVIIVGIVMILIVYVTLKLFAKK
jgi:hypothetical protein